MSLKLTSRNCSRFFNSGTVYEILMSFFGCLVDLCIRVVCKLIETNCVNALITCNFTFRGLYCFRWSMLLICTYKHHYVLVNIIP